MTGMRLSRCTRSMSERPPRGTITSMRSGMASIIAHGGAVARRHELDRVGRQAAAAMARAQARDDRARGVEALRAAAQDRGIAGAQAQRRRRRR